MTTLCQAMKIAKEEKAVVTKCLNFPELFQVDILHLGQFRFDLSKITPDELRVCIQTRSKRRAAWIESQSTSK